MKNINLLIWVSQLGLSIAVPLGGLIWLSVWLRNSCGWGDWVVIAGVALGVILAIDGLRTSLKAMSRMAKDEKKDPPPVSFNDHD